MNKNLKTLVIGGGTLVVTAFILAAVESKGAIIESRVGMVGVLLTALFIFISVYLLWERTKAAPPPAQEQPPSKPAKKK